MTSTHLHRYDEQEREMETPGTLVLDFPFRRHWLARNSPARRIPSHGTHRFGTTYAIDFIAVDRAGRPAPLTWRTLVSLEPPERFLGFGLPILAPASGEVVRARVGDLVTSGEQVGECGNSGNSTQPHVHVQATDSLSWSTTRGLPIAFRRRTTDSVSGPGAALIPGESEIVDAG